MGYVVFLVLLSVAGGVLLLVLRTHRRREAERRRAALEPVKRLAFEDVTAFGEALRELDSDLLTDELDEGENADYQRALDSYEQAKTAADRMERPEDVKHVTEILEDGRYAMACVRARVAGAPLPTRRPPCFFDPRHGLSVENVPWAPPGGTTRDVPACALDAERVKAGAEPDVRKVLVGSRRVPYWQGGRAYQPYAAGYYGGFDPMGWMFAGMMFSDIGGGLGEGLGWAAEGIGDGIGAVFDGVGSMFDGIGDMFDGFDF